MRTGRLLERFDLRTAMAASERDPDSCLDALDAAIVTRNAGYLDSLGWAHYKLGQYAEAVPVLMVRGTATSAPATANVPNARLLMLVYVMSG